MQERGIECNYEPCNCLTPGAVDAGEAYCSEFCRGAADDGLEAESCACGHPPCDEP